MSRSSRTWLYEPVSTAGGLLLLRFWTGIAIMTHGWPKVFDGRMERFTSGVAEMGFPIPEFFAWAAALSELVGGALLVVGLLTRPAAAMIAATMLVAAFLRKMGQPFGERELALIYLAASLTLLLTGPGRFSLDRLLVSKRR